MLNIIYIFSVMLFAIGFYILITSNHYLSKLLGMSIFQNSVLVFYIALGKRWGGSAPFDRCSNLNIYSEEYLKNNCHDVVISSPLPHVLMLTAVVVGLATLSLGIALIYRIYKSYGTVLENEINEKLDGQL
ncbi:MAG: cation:proton antiporter subunit C [Rickettsia sp.]|nr:cation:proton antiporter subunit C [Rickettsia sp.]